MSWFNSDNTIGTCLDKFFVSRDLVNMVTLCDIIPCVFSDHDFVHLHIRLNHNFQRGPGLWKLNNSLLSDWIFCDYVSVLVISRMVFLLFLRLRNGGTFLKSPFKVISFPLRKTKVNFSLVSGFV